MTRTARHHKNTKKVLLIIAGIAVVLFAGYAVYGNHFSDRFLPNTEINGTNISNLTVAEANKKLKGSADKLEFTITDNGQTWKKIKKTELGMRTDYTKQLENVKDSQNQWTWGMAYVFASEKDSLDGVAIDEKTLDQKTNDLKKEIDEFNKSRTKTQDAKLSKGPAGFNITPEVVGNTVATDKIITDFKKAVTDHKDSLELLDYTEKPKVTAQDQKLKDEVATLNQVAQVQANYSINGNTFQIPTENIMEWLVYKDGKATLDKTKVRTYVADLGAQYNTSSNPTTFKSTKRGEVTVPDGTLSWTIQTDAETEALAKQIMEGQPFTRSPITQGSGTADKPLVGNTYIEVDLQNQHMWYYKDGAVALETDIVSGKPKTPTPPGVFYVWNKETNTTLKGKNDDGTKYESPVDYWMPIDWTGVGIHDSDWQPTYGGDWWKNNGSHGCVNTPPDVMAKLFNMVEKGTPVLVF